MNHVCILETASARMQREALITIANEPIPQSSPVEQDLD
jgi:hypothetical protein